MNKRKQQQIHTNEIIHIDLFHGFAMIHCADCFPFRPRAFVITHIFSCFVEVHSHDDGIYCLQIHYLPKQSSRTFGNVIYLLY